MSLKTPEQYWTYNHQKMLVPCDADESLRLDYLERREMIYDVLADFPQNREGIDFGRIGAFAEKYALRLPNIIVVDSKEVENLNGALSAFSPSYKLTAKWRAAHLSTLDTIVAIRHRELEELNGPELAESDIIHEIGHSQQYYEERNVVYRLASGSIISPSILRDGLRVADAQNPPILLGSFFTEAHAEYLRGYYVAHHLGKEGGFTDRPEKLMPWQLHDFAYYLPSRYTNWLKHEDSPGGKAIGAPSSAYAAYAMELLNNINPQVLPSLQLAIRAPKNIRPFIKAVNTVESGLYQYLRSLANDDENHTEGLKKVVDVITRQK